MRGFIYLMVLLTIVMSCNRNISAKANVAQSGDSIVITSSVDPSTPACISRKIDSIRQQPVWNPPAEIYEYEYQGRKVYAISSNCCDFFNTVVDAECKYVCAPSGGFTGRGDGKCADFSKVAKQIRLVWKDERVRK
jgi:hypothetical protein